jgi:FtsP/CotA-like multicopper oxidase with cupredoxin domain
MNRSTRFSHLTRRQFVKLAGVGTGTLLLSSCDLIPTATGAHPSLPTIPRAASTGRVSTYTLEAAPVTLSLGGKTVSTWAYNGGVSGPTLRLTEGDTLKVTVKNRLPQGQGTTIHWHGVPLINAMDGVPDATQHPIASGQDFVYTFVVPTAGTYFYHSHVGLQLDRGLYGPLIIDPTHETMSYDQDFVLLLDDWLDGLPGTPDDAMQKLIAGGDQMGRMGGTGTTSGMSSTSVPPDITYPLYLINGRGSNQPTELKVTRGDKVRLRFINSSAATIYHVALQGHAMTVTHTDGQAVEPVEVDALRIGMGERYDVLVTANNPGVWQLAAKVEGAPGMVRALMSYKGSVTTHPPAIYQPAELTGKMLRYVMLKAAPGLVVPPAYTPDQTVPIQLSGGNGQYVWKLNDEVFPKAQQIAIQRNKLINFPMQNMSMMPHPMHLHGHFFQLDNGTGRGPLKDTVLVDPMQSLTVNWISDNPGIWAFHCHNAYHMGAGMMRFVSVQ